VIACTRLTKIYTGGKVALRDLTLEIPRGASFGLLGENGAGKSTFARLVVGLDLPTAGTLQVLGERKVTRAHGRIGYVHEHPALEQTLTGRAYLSYLARLAGLWGRACRDRVEAALDQVDLGAAVNRRIGGYSKGMRQRLTIAQALLTDPDLLLLDEPTSGLDPGGQHEVRETLRSLRDQGKTMVLCSHALPEVERLCDSVGILRRGRLVRVGRVSDLLRVDSAVEVVLEGDEPAQALAARLNVGDAVISAEERTLRIQAAAQDRVLAALVHADVRLRSLNPVARSLEDVYLRATRESQQRAQGGHGERRDEG
jgi:ABC-2 type transport system ATP-binding protein